MSKPGLSLVTGGCGFIGRHLVQTLINQDQPVRVLDTNPGSDLFEGKADVWQGSILDVDQLEKVMQGVSVVYHLAAIPHLWTADQTDYQEVNVKGTEQVLAAALAAGIERFVYTSSETVLGNWRLKSQKPINEQTPQPQLPDLPGPYSKSKLEAELAVRKAIDQGLPGIVVYPTIPIGAGDDNLTPPTRMIRDFIQGKNPAYLECTLNLIPVQAVAEGHLLAAKNGAVGERYILGQDNYKLSELLAALEQLTGKKMPKRKVNYTSALITARAMELAAKLTGITPAASVEGVRLAGANMAYDSSKAHKELGLPSYSIPQALQETTQWLEHLANDA
jgi:dihydroflavonol-4-reductase